MSNIKSETLLKTSIAISETSAAPNTAIVTPAAISKELPEVTSRTVRMSHKKTTNATTAMGRVQSPV